jgi:predicted amidohydrolase
MGVIVSSTCFPGRPTASENIAVAADLLDEAGRRGSDITCLPESFTHRRQEVIEALDGPAVTMARAKAQQHRMWVIAPITERRGKALYNSSVLIDRAGGIVGSYDKVHPTPGELEHGITPGNDLPVFDTDFGRIAILTCYDHDWPEMFAAYARKGARIVFWPTMVYGYTEFDNEIRKSAICFDHGLYLVASNYYHWSESEPAPVRDFRHTFIMAPEGVALANTSYRPGVVTAHIDLGYQWPARDHSEAVPQAWPSLLEPFRRPDLYQAMLNPAPNPAPLTPSPRRRLRVAAIALPAGVPPDADVSLSTIDRMLDETHSVSLAVLPENCLGGGAAEERTDRVTPVSSEHMGKLAGLARRHDLHVLAPVYRSDQGGLFAASLLFNRRGEVVASYRKTHLSAMEKEQHGVGSGDDLPVFETELGPVGILLGRDIFYPEAFAVLAAKGAELVLWSGSGYPLYPNAYQMSHLLAARPLAYGVPLVAAMCAQPRPHPSARLQRDSCVIDHYGHVLAGTGFQPGVAEATLDLPPVYQSPVQGTRQRLADRPRLCSAAYL